MSALSNEFLTLIEQNIRFEYQSGGSTLVGFPHTTGWRVLPSLVVAHLEYEAIVERTDEKPLKIMRGQTFAIAPGMMHRATKLDRRPRFSYWAHLQCEVLQGVSLFFLIEPPLLMTKAASARIGRLLKELAEISESASSLTSLLRRQAVGWQLILALLEKASFTRERLDLARSASRLTPVLAYIEENLARPISHQLLAQTAGLSPSRFHVVFRAALGAAPYAYVQKLRLRRAQQLLARTDRSVAEIGQEVGHPDPYHFSRVFRRAMGVSPKMYRRQAIGRSL